MLAVEKLPSLLEDVCATISAVCSIPEAGIESEGTEMAFRYSLHIKPIWRPDR